MSPVAQPSRQQETAADVDTARSSLDNRGHDITQTPTSVQQVRDLDNLDSFRDLRFT